MNISKKAMIVKLHISAWKARIADKDVTEKTNKDHMATNDAGIYNKFLVAKKHLSDIQKSESDARSYHMKNTLPWKDGGDRLLPAKNFQTYSQGMRERKQKFEAAVHQFINQYPVLVTNAKNTLGNMYDKAEYPTPGSIEELFKFHTDVHPVPVADDFRVELSEHEVSKIKKDLNASNAKNNANAMKNLWDQLHGVVKTMANGMKDVIDPVTKKITKKGRVFDSYIENINDLVEILPNLNIDDDQKLNDMADEIKITLTANTPGQLRKDPQLKNDIAEEAQKVVDKMTGFMGAGGGQGAINQ